MAINRGSGISIGPGITWGQGIGGPGITDRLVLGPPVNTVAPAVSGNLFVGATLSCTTGTWTPAPDSYAYQWYRAPSTAISGATASTYVLQSADIGASIFCRVTATNAAGSTPADSNTVAVTALLLQSLSTAAAGAWSFSRCLSYTMIGQPLFQLRRSSDSDLLQILGGSDGLPDFSGYAAWAGADDIFVRDSYDHSGNGKTLTQATAGNQPRFSLTGAGTNSKPYVYQLTTTQTLAVALGWGVTVDADHSLATYGKLFTGGLSFTGIIGVGNTSSSSCIGNSGSPWWFGGAFQGGGTGGTSDANWHSFVKRHNSSNTYGLVDGSAVTSTDLAFNLSSDTLVFGKYNGANQTDTVGMSEAIAFASDIGATDASAISTSQASFYG